MNIRNRFLVILFLAAAAGRALAGNRIVPGIGLSDANQSRIEAEDFFDLNGGEVKECPAGGFEVRGLQAGSRLIYPKVRHLRENARVLFHLASGNPAGGTIEIRLNGARGDRLGICPAPFTGGWDRYRTVSCDLTNKAGTSDLCLVIEGGTGELLRLDWLAFNSAVSAPVPASVAGASGATSYPDGRPVASLRLDAKGHGVVLKHGDGPQQCDMLGAREASVVEEHGVYHLFYDGAGPKGWLACLATSKDLIHWEKKGPVLDLGKAGEMDCASASSPWTILDGKTWHMFYLGTRRVRRRRTGCR